MSCFPYCHRRGLSQNSNETLPCLRKSRGTGWGCSSLVQHILFYFIYLFSYLFVCWLLACLSEALSSILSSVNNKQYCADRIESSFLSSCVLEGAHQPYSTSVFQLVSETLRVVIYISGAFFLLPPWAFMEDCYLRTTPDRLTIGP